MGGGLEQFHKVCSPNSLKNLEELTLNENFIQELPSCLGLLRQLHTLIVDCNQLKSLPNSICSCSQLRILSLADNFITKLPEDLGRLTQLQVLNLCNNSLAYLPFSMTKISNIKAIWLSENQNKPLIQFHSETIQDQYPHKVLTCFLFPQVKDGQGTSEGPSNGNSLEVPGSALAVRRRSSFLLTVNIDKPLIEFAQQFSSTNGEDNDDGQAEEEYLDDDRSNNASFGGRVRIQGGPAGSGGGIQFDDIGDMHGDGDGGERPLLRHPTPYPKDLKVHASHARNLKMKHLDLGSVDGSNKNY